MLFMGPGTNNIFRALAVTLTLVWVAQTTCASTIASQQKSNLHIDSDEYEKLLITALSEIQNQKLDKALLNMETLVNRNPRFKLAQLIYADLLQARTSVITDFGAKPGISKDIVTDLLDEARQRWKHHVNTPTSGLIPDNILYIGKEFKHIIMVDVNSSRLYVFDNQSEFPQIVTDYYVSIGKEGFVKQKSGDKRTPLGVYQITKHIPDSKLPDFYGAGAFPINYPNKWDRRLGKTGYGIWLHGTPVDTYSRPPLASDGCVALSNPDFITLKPYVEITKTPVVITDGIRWLTKSEWEAEQQKYISIIQQWEKDWESRNTDRYLSHYSKNFKSDDLNYWSWVKHKKRVGTNKTFIKVKLSDINIYRYPGTEDTIQVNFHQEYESNNFRQSAEKRQYWHKEKDGQWRIIYEGSA